MILIMESMEEKIPLIKKKKKAITLVEIMASIAIITILFLAISGVVSNSIKIEKKSNDYLKSNDILKTALLLFNNNTANIELYNSEKEISFNDIEDMKIKIENADTTVEEDWTYKVIISVIKVEDEIYEVTANLINRDNSEFSKKLFVYSKD